MICEDALYLQDRSHGSRKKNKSKWHDQASRKQELRMTAAKTSVTGYGLFEMMHAFVAMCS